MEEKKSSKRLIIGIIVVVVIGIFVWRYFSSKTGLANKSAENKANKWPAWKTQFCGQPEAGAIRQCGAEPL